MNDNDIIEELYPHAKYYIDDESWRYIWKRWYRAYFPPGAYASASGYSSDKYNCGSPNSAVSSSISVHAYRRCKRNFIKLAFHKTYDEILAYIEDMERKRRRPTPTSRRVQELGRE